MNGDSSSILNLNFLMQPQQQPEWCWAAIGASVAQFFQDSPALTQCQIVNSCLGKTTCCSDGAGVECDQTFYLEKSLGVGGNFVNVMEGAQTLETIRAQISGGNPMCARIQWSSGGAHFIVIAGVGPDSPQGDDQTLITVEDPELSAGSSQITYQTLKSGYRGTGTWTHSYFTRKSSDDERSI